MDRRFREVGASRPPDVFSGLLDQAVLYDASRSRGR